MLDSFTRMTLIAGLIAGLTPACRSSSSTSQPPAPTPTPAAPVPLPTAAAPAPLPAGLYFRSFQYSTCKGCPTPTTAVLIGSYTTAEQASRTLAAIPAAELPLGYPLAAHTDELGIASGQPGVALVAGLFAERASAEAFVRAHPALHDATVVAVLPDDELRKLRAARYGEGEQKAPFVVRLAADDVPAYARAGIDPEGDQLPRIGEKPRELRELCRLSRPALFVSSAWDDRGFYRVWAPVDCGGQPAYVRWQDTLIESTVERQPDGTYVLTQVVDVVEDSPTLGRWRYDAGGRREPLPPK
jgi:hypothetical protein